MSLNLPGLPVSAQPNVLVETQDEREVEKRIFIGADDTMVSPIISMHGPTFTMPSAGSHPFDPHSSSMPTATAAAAVAVPVAATSSKFYHISNSNMYVFVEGAPLFQNGQTADFTLRMSDMPLGRGGATGLCTPLSDTAGGSTFAKATNSMASDGPSGDAPRERRVSGADKHRTSVSTGSSSSGGGFSAQRTASSASSSFLDQASEDADADGLDYDMDQMEIGSTVGSGQQGCVQLVSIAGKPFALKRVNITDAAQSDNDVERQGRKSGIVRELNMIRDQRCKKASPYVVRLHNACVRRFQEKQELHILMELLSSSVEDLQKLASRLPYAEMVSLTQRSFKSHLTGQQLATPKEKLFGSFELINERQTAFPEIFLSLLANDLLHGLDHLHHTYRYVHCDLKQANVLLGLNQFGFKIADFGCSSQAGEDGRVSRLGAGLGSKLYMAPERIPDDGFENSPVSFTTKSDIWSLGIVLLELAAGCHPCEHFKSDFWNFKRILAPENLVAPISWTNDFQDFVIKCLSVDASKRPSAKALLDHAFIRRYAKVPRAALKRFVTDLRTSSTTYQKKIQRESLKQHLTIATKTNDQHRHRQLSKKVWTSFTGFLNHPPETSDPDKFPSLS